MSLKKVIDSLLSEKTEEASDHLHNFLAEKANKMLSVKIKGKKKKKEENEESCQYEEDKDDEKEEDDKDDEEVSESTKPSAGLTKDEKSKIVKKAKAGKDIGKKGKDFEKVAKKASKEYGSAEIGKKVAAAAMWKAEAKKK